MAGNDSQEKTEDATPKRLREARKKGQIAKSKDLTTVFVLIIVFIVLALTIEILAKELKEFMAYAFGLVELDPIPGERLMTLGKMAVTVLAKVLIPILFSGFIAAALIGFLQAGPVFTAEPLKPKFEKLNPIEGFKNMFKIVTLIELVKNIIKITIVIYLAYSTISNFISEILMSSQINITEAVSLTGEIVYSFFIKVMAVFFIISLIDMSVQRWNFLKNMRMSKDEVKREYKEDEGDPQIKGERKRIHREMVFGDVKNNVKKSDGVVSNPVHVAIAIKYDREEMAAPEITAKGQRKMAEMILKIAREENVPIIRNIPLAWSLLQLEEGDAIPEDLYEPVAEVLSLIYDMKEQANQSTTQTQAPQEANKSDFDPFA